MNVQGISVSSGRSRTDFSLNADDVKEKRAAVSKSMINEPEDVSDPSANSIQPEELIKNIKALTEDGVYSVQFEVDQTTHDLVINLIDQESGEVLRQVPSEEVLGSRRHLAELRGNILQTES